MKRYPTSLSAIPSATGGIARAALAEARKSGVKIAPLLKGAGLSTRQALDRQLRIPVPTQIEFLNRVASAIGDDVIGFNLAQKFEFGEIGLLYYVQSSSDTLGAALSRLARYSRIANEGIVISYRKGCISSVTFNHRGLRRIDDTHQIEFFVTALVRMCRHVTQRHITPQTISFVHRRAVPPREMVRYFGCVPEFGASTDQVVLKAPDVDLKLIEADPYLNSLLEKYCEETLAKRAAKLETWRSNVENVLAPMLPHGRATISRVAHQLNVSSRTLVRRLAAERITFREIVDHLRCHLAQTYLREPGLSISEIAWLLGFAQPSAFSHAFRRWTHGSTPEQFRKFDDTVNA